MQQGSQENEWYVTTKHAFVAAEQKDGTNITA
jgi:hypothetical protein